MVIQSIKSVFAIMMLIFTGFYFAGKKWFGKPGMDFLSKFTVEATLPFYMFYSIHRDIGTRKGLIELFSKLPVTFCLILFILLLAALTGRVLRIAPERRNTFTVACGFPNVVFIGFPVIQALWGDGITSVGAVYYISSTVLFWTIGIWLLQRDGKSGKASEKAFLSGLKMLISPAIIGMLAAMLVVFFEIPVSDIILKPLSMISQLTSPLALIFIGSVIRNMDPSSITLGKDVAAALFVRFLVVPAAAVFFLRLMPIPTQMREVFFMLSTMPAMAQMGIMARQYNRDYEFACTIITMTTVISMLTIPLFMYLIQQFQIFGA